ncbi:MAG: ABC transporter permease [Deltaproteobacteria bacterium]|nr:ABC transporter permease [Deltaproteobacteria bacterium]
MVRYLLKRVFLMIPTLLGITLITFAMMHLAPGDPAALKAQQGTEQLASDQMSEEILAQTRALYGLDQPLPIQYLRWLGRIATLDFGESYRDHRPVLEKIGDALPITLTLNVLSIFIIYIIAIPLGAFAALKPGSFVDRASAIGLFVLYSLPSFWVAMMLIVYLGGGDHLNWFPIAGFISDGADMLPWWGKIANIAWHLVLPVACLTYGGFAFLSRFARTSVLEVIRQDFIRTARAKGCSERQVLVRHAMRNSLIPMLTLMGALLPELLGGSVIIEQIFALPGMGRLGFESVLARDYPVVMAIATISAVLTLVGILITDILYVIVDPRITYGGRR